MLRSVVFRSVGRVMAGKVRFVKEWYGRFGQGRTWQVRFVGLSSVMSRCAMARQVRRV